MPTSKVSKKKDYVAAEHNIVLNVCRKITIEVKLSLQMASYDYLVI